MKSMGFHHLLQWITPAILYNDILRENIFSVNSVEILQDAILHIFTYIQNLDEQAK